MKMRQSQYGEGQSLQSLYSPLDSGQRLQAQRNKSDTMKNRIRFVYFSARSIWHRHIFQFRLGLGLIDQALKRDSAQIIGHDPVESLPHRQRHAE